MRVTKIKNINSNHMIMFIIILLSIIFIIFSTLFFKNIKEQILLIDVKNTNKTIENINKNINIWLHDKHKLLEFTHRFYNIKDKNNIQNIQSLFNNISEFDNSFDILQLLYKDNKFYTYQDSKLTIMDNYQLDKLNKLDNPYNKSWYKDTKKSLVPTFCICKCTNICNSKLTEDAIIISIPIIYDNKFTGVLAGVITIDNLLEKLNRLSSNENVHIFLLLNNNEIFFSKNETIKQKIKDKIKQHVLKKDENKNVEDGYIFINDLQFDIGKIGFYLDKKDIISYFHKFLFQAIIFILTSATILIIANLLYKIYYYYLNRNLINNNKLKDFYLNELNENKHGLILLDKNHKITFINNTARDFLHILEIKDIFTFFKQDRKIIKHNNKSLVLNKIPIHQYGNFYGTILYIADITEKKYIQQQKEINEYILMHQTKMIEIGELIGGINHQLKQPINSISILIENIICFKKNNILTDELLDKNLKYCQDSIKMLDKTINLYNNYYNNSINIKYFNLYECIINIINIIDAGKNFKNIKSNICLDGNKNLMINSLENIVSQIMLILLSNAKDAIENKEYSKDKNIIVDYFVENENVIINVSDYGSGIDKNIQEGLFQEIKTTKKKGVGIGLYFAKKIANSKLKGDLYITSYFNPTIFSLKIKKNLN